VVIISKENMSTQKHLNDMIRQGDLLRMNIVINYEHI